MTLEMNTPPAACPRCGHRLRSSLVKTTIWQRERLFVVENVPAQVCDECMEQFYDDETTDAVRRLTEEGFPGARATREILVPVFSLQKDALPAGDTSA